MTTGFSEKVEDGRVEETGIREVVMKPLGVRRMAETVRRVLDGAGE